MNLETYRDRNIVKKTCLEKNIEKSNRKNLKVNLKINVYSFKKMFLPFQKRFHRHSITSGALFYHLQI